MPQREVTSLSVKELDRRTSNNDGDVEETDVIVIASEFQRGDEETGVWKKKNKQDLIASIENNYSTGILSLVKPSATQARREGQTLSYYVLDGGNRLRAIRDFRNGSWPTQDGTYYKDMNPTRQAEFDNSVLPVEKIGLLLADPKDTIAKMFKALNTTAVCLSPGELIKAHGWLKNKNFIEMSKFFIGDIWETKFSNDSLGSASVRWKALFGGRKHAITETDRCLAMATICAFFVSAHTGKFSLFDKNYDKLSPYLDTVLDIADITHITEKINTFLGIMEVIYSPLIFSISKGIPCKKHINAIWKKICEGAMDSAMSEKMKTFYTAIAEDTAARDRYKQVMSKNGDNHATSSKIADVLSMIKTWPAKLE